MQSRQMPPFTPIRNYKKKKKKKKKKEMTRVIGITKTLLLYRKIWGLQGCTLFFLFLLKTIDCGYSL